MSIKKVKVKLVLCIAFIMTIIVLSVGFMGIGISIYGARFYVFAAIATFISLILVHTILSSIFAMIEENEKRIKASIEIGSQI